MGVGSYLHHLGTCLPENRFRQEDLCEELSSRFEDPRTRRLIAQAFRRSGIETRNFAVEGFRDSDPFDDEGRASTAARNARFAIEARTLASRLGKDILAQPGAPAPDEITHVIFTTCTGFVNPGPDFHLVNDLGLPESVERYTVGFMGCYAAFPTLRMADQFCRANPDANVLCICLELSSLHTRFESDPDVILGNTVFADGAAGGIVSGNRPRAELTGGYRLDRFATATLPDGEADMAWTIGDQGFDLVLSSYVPKVISAEIGNVLERTGFSRDDVDRFAVHPGGKAILDRIESALDLAPDALEASREVLRDCGNMSSATILFVLQRLLETIKTGDRTLAVAFGPGLTVETAGLVGLAPVSPVVPVEESADAPEDAALTL